MKQRARDLRGARVERAENRRMFERAIREAHKRGLRVRRPYRKDKVVVDGVLAWDSMIDDREFVVDVIVFYACKSVVSGFGRTDALRRQLRC